MALPGLISGSNLVGIFLREDKLLSNDCKFLTRWGYVLPSKMVSADFMLKEQQSPWSVGNVVKICEQGMEIPLHLQNLMKAAESPVC